MRAMTLVRKGIWTVPGSLYWTGHVCRQVFEGVPSQWPQLSAQIPRICPLLLCSGSGIKQRALNRYFDYSPLSTYAFTDFDHITAVCLVQILNRTPAIHTNLPFHCVYQWHSQYYYCDVTLQLNSWFHSSVNKNINFSRPMNSLMYARIFAQLNAHSLRNDTLLPNINTIQNNFSGFPRSTFPFSHKSVRVQLHWSQSNSSLLWLDSNILKTNTFSLPPLICILPFS